MIAARPRHRVCDVNGVGRAALRVVVLVPERRVAGDRDEAETSVARVAPRLGQSHIAVDDAPLFGEHAGRDAVEADTSLVEQIRRKNVRRACDGILSAPRDVAAVTGERRESRAAERFEQAAIGEAVATHQVECAAECRVAADIEMIRSIAFGRRRDIVADLLGAVGARIERRNRTADRVSQGRGKCIARSVGRNCADPGDAFVGTRALVVGEEERAVADDRSADRESRLRALILRIGLTFRREVVRRVERPVSEERVGCALQLVGARLHHHADLRSGLATMRCLRGARQHFEFLNRIHGRTHAGGVQLRIDVVGAVEQETVEILPATVDAEREIPADGARGSLRCRGGTGRKQCQLEKVSAVERHVQYLAVLDDGAHCRRIAPQIDVPRGHFDAIGERTDLQLRIGTPLLIHGEHDALYVRLVALRANFHPPGAWRQLCERECSGVAALRRARFVGGFVDRGHRGAGNNRARRILHASANSATMALSIQSSRQHHHQRGDPHRIGNHHAAPLVSTIDPNAASRWDPIFSTWTYSSNIQNRMLKQLLAVIALCSSFAAPVWAQALRDFRGRPSCRAWRLARGAGRESRRQIGRDRSPLFMGS